jgi:hypothetical protein
MVMERVKGFTVCFHDDGPGEGCNHEQELLRVQSAWISPHDCSEQLRFLIVCSARAAAAGRRYLRCQLQHHAGQP